MTKTFISIPLLVALVFGCTFNATAQLPSGFQETTVMQLGQSISVEFLPDGRMLLAQKNGIFRIAEPPFYNNPVIYMQLTNVDGSQERGVTTIVLDPDFDTNGYFYVYYSPTSPMNFRVSRFTHQENAGGLTSTANVSSETVIWQDPNNYVGCCHFGGGMDIGPDGKLYLCTGEITNSSDVQLLDNAYGKVLRINLDGSIPVDNPYNDGAGPNHDYIWAYGLRNPFRAFWDEDYGQFYISEVGGNDQAIAQEDIHLGTAGANFGWPYCEGVNCNFPNGVQPADFSPPMHTYGHTGAIPGGAIVGGPVYRGGMFPSQYEGAMLSGDYVQNVIRVYELDISGTQVLNEFIWHTNPGLVVDIEVAPDGSVFIIDLLGNIRQITYNGSNLAPLCDSVNVTPLFGPIGTQVTCTGIVSDPENDALTWTWDYDDGGSSSGNLSGTGSQNLPTKYHTFNNNGLYDVRLSVSDGDHIVNCPTSTVQIGAAPTATITSPSDGTMFQAGDIISFGASGFDPNGTLSPSNYTWEIMFLHNEHVHPEVPASSGYTQGNFAIPLDGHDYSDSTGYEIRLTITDNEGLQGFDTVRIYPDKVYLTLLTSPPGLTIEVDGVPRQTPYVLDDVIGFHHYVNVLPQCDGQDQYGFASWSDGGSAFHQITAPATNSTLTANLNYWGTCQNQLFLDAKAYLQGPYDVVSGLMKDNLREQGFIPLQEPHTLLGMPQVNSGGESINANILTVTGNDAIVDWVMIEVRDETDPATVLKTYNALIQRDGDIVDLDGISDIELNLTPNDYYFSIRHRNHLGVMTGNSISVAVGTSTLDFTNVNFSTYGTNAQFSNTWVNMLWQGNTNGDGIVKYSGSNNDRDKVLISLGGNAPTATLVGYQVEDCNLDGVVRYTGSSNDRDPILLNIGGNIPTATRNEQLP